MCSACGPYEKFLGPTDVNKSNRLYIVHSMCRRIDANCAGVNMHRQDSTFALNVTNLTETRLSKCNGDIYVVE